MNRREILAWSAALAIAALGTAPVEADTVPPPDDPLNPAGIRMAGVKMIPVRSGKYKVWTKTIGDGPVKVLLLHGGPGASILAAAKLIGPTRKWFCRWMI